MKKHWNEVYDKTNEIMEKVCDETGAEWEEINQKSIGFKFPEYSEEEKWEELFEDFKKFLES